MINVDEVRKYNADCQTAQNKANQGLAKIEVLDKQIETLCTELSTLLGRTVTKENYEQVYQEVSADVENIVKNGNDLLRRVQEERAANEAGIGQTPSTGMNMGQAPAQNINDGRAPVNNAPAQGIMGTNPNWNNNNSGMPAFNNGNMVGGTGLPNQQNQQGQMNQQNQQGQMNQQNQQNFAGQSNFQGQQGMGYGQPQGQPQGQTQGGPFGTAQTGLLPNSSIPVAQNAQQNFNNNNRGQVPLPMGEFNTGGIIGQPVTDFT